MDDLPRHGLRAVAWTLLLLAGPLRAQGVRIVEAPGLGSLPDIQSAVDAAADGDTLLVAPGSYAGFVIDGKQLAVTTNRHRKAMIHAERAEIVRINVRTKKITPVPGLPGGPKHFVRWSPDGKRLAYAGREGTDGEYSTDEITLEPGDLQPLWNVVSDPAVPVLMHGADYDIRILDPGGKEVGTHEEGAVVVKLPSRLWPWGCSCSSPASPCGSRRAGPLRSLPRTPPTCRSRSTWIA